MRGEFKLFLCMLCVALCAVSPSTVYGLATSHQPAEKDSSGYSLFDFYTFEEGKLTDKHLPNKKGIEAGPFLLHSAVRVEEEFDTNIYLERQDEKFDAITLVAPSVGFELEMADHRLEADYTAGFYMFADHNSENHIDHQARALAELNFTDFTVTFEDIYRNYSHRAGSEDTNRVKHMDNDLRAGVSAEFDQLTYDVGFTFGINDFLSDDVLYLNMTYDHKDRNEYTFDFLMKYRFLPKTSLVVDGYFGWIDYDSNLSSDSTWAQAYVGLEGNLKKNLKVDASVGLRYSDYKPADLSTYKDYLGVVAKGGVLYFITLRDLLNFNIERSIYESIYNDMNYYVVNLAGLHYSHAFNDKMHFTVFGKYQYNTYPSATMQDGVIAKRYDHIFGGGCMFRYDIQKWLAVETRYEYKQRDSRFAVFDYIDHVVTLSGSAGF